MTVDTQSKRLVLLCLIGLVTLYARESAADHTLVNEYDGYTLKYPNPPWRVQRQTHANDIVEIRNFSASKRLVGCH